MARDLSQSPASKAMDEAIELGIQGESPYPERAAFIDADQPGAVREIERAADDGYAVVLVSADGTTRVLQPQRFDARNGAAPRPGAG